MYIYSVAILESWQDCPSFIQMYVKLSIIGEAAWRA